MHTDSKQLFFLRFKAFTILLMLVLMLVSLSAATALCRGADCEGQDPKETGCIQDAIVIESVPLSDIDNEQEFGSISLLYSASCHAKWALATTPFTFPNMGTALLRGEAFFSSAGQGTAENNFTIWTPMTDAKNQVAACGTGSAEAPFPIGLGCTSHP